MGSTARRMLIVDDEQTVCGCLEQFFGKRGFTVTSAFSGEEALAKLKDGAVDILLLDILLPGIHGIEVLKRAKQLYPSARVIVMTALDHQPLQEEARRYGADAFVMKPFDLSDTTWSVVLADSA